MFRTATYRAISFGGLAVGCALVLSASVAQAQQSAAASSGAFGARSLGSAFTPNAGGFTGSGSGGASGNGMAAAGMGGVSGMTQRGDASAGQVTGNERFVRGARRPGQFVGADNADSSNLMSQLSSMAQGQLGPQRNNATTNPNRTQGNQGARRTMPRVELDLAFEYRTKGPTEAAVTLQNRFTQSPKPGLRGRVIVNLEGRTAVLRGNVATEHDRVLAERVALLEAGVSQVRNELQVVRTEPIPPPTDAAPSSQTAPPSAQPPVLPPAKP